MIKKIKLWIQTRTAEQEMLINRLIIGILAAGGSIAGGADPGITQALMLYLLWTTVAFVLQHAGIFNPKARWFFGVLLDIWVCTVVMLLEPQLMVWIYPLMQWVILSNGFRYGVRFLGIASLMSALAFAAIVASTAYWNQHFILGFGLAAGLLIIPGYCASLIHKLAQARHQAELANRAKSYFLASVSHELRTPLSAILGYGNHLKQMNLSKKQYDMVEASVMAGDHLLKLIEQLIQVATAESSTITTKDSIFRPTDLLIEIHDIMAIRAQDKGLALKLHAAALTDERVEGPEDVVRNILINLMGNAVKFTDTGCISLQCAIIRRQDQEYLSVTISDTGIGIAENALERIFQPFQQADETFMNRFGGTGLGLAICKQLAEQSNGEITVTSRLGIGSAFRVMIPIKVATRQNEAEDNPPQTMRIISLGHLQPQLLASAQAGGDYSVRHVDCTSILELQVAINTHNIRQYDIALIDQNLAAQIELDDPIWDQLAAAEVAPILVGSAGVFDVDDIALRAAFTSIVSPSPNFQEIRSALHIARSFTRQPGFAQAEEAQPALPLNPYHILVADDNRTNRNILAAILETAGHQVTMAADGDEAIEFLRSGGIDILLLDVNMPRLNGIETSIMWRKMEDEAAHLPIIGVTADATAETEASCLAAGMDMRITKPVDAKLVLNIVNQYCADKPGQQKLDQKLEPVRLAAPAPHAGIGPLPTLDQIQIDYLLSIGDAAFFGDMIDSFREDIDETIIAMRAAVADKDARQFRACAHAFKSSSSNIGAKSLIDITSRLENIGDSDFHAKGSRYLTKIETEIIQIHQALDQQLAKLAALQETADAAIDDSPEREKSNAA